MDAPAFLGADVALLIDRGAEHVHDAPEGLFADRDGYRRARCLHFYTAFEAVRRAHGDGADDAVSQLLLDLEGQADLLDEEGLVDLGHGVRGELRVHHGTDDLYHLT